MNQEQLEILRTEVANPDYAGMDYETIAVALNSPGPNVPNPEPQGEVPVPIGLVDILGVLTLQERIAILGGDTFRELCLRQWAIGDNPYLDGVMAFVALDPSLPFETISTYGVATRLVELQQSELLQALMIVLVQDGKITEATAVTLAGLLARTQPDPSWTTTIKTASRREALGLPIVLATDIQQVA